MDAHTYLRDQLATVPITHPDGCNSNTNRSCGSPPSDFSHIRGVSDEDSVNIDECDEENYNTETDPRESGALRANPNLGRLDHSGYQGHSYLNPEGIGRELSAFAYRDELLMKNSESDRSREAFCELGAFSAFRFLPQQQGEENCSPHRNSPEVNLANGYLLPAKESRPTISKSPGNLCSLSSSKELLEFSARNSHTNMLEHKLPFNFLGPPLAALHSMTEMKSSLSGAAGGDSNNNNTSAPSMSSPNAGLTAQTMHGQATAPNPHGIDTILSRPPPVTSAGLSSLTAG